MGGTNYQLAKWAEEGAKDVGAGVKHQAKRTVTVAEWIKKAKQ